MVGVGVAGRGGMRMYVVTYDSSHVGPSFYSRKQELETGKWFWDAESHEILPS